MPAAQNPDEPDADPGQLPPADGVGEAAGDGARDGARDSARESEPGDARDAGPDDDAVWRAIVDNYGERALLDDEAMPTRAAVPEPPAAEVDWFNATESDESFSPPEPEPLQLAPDRALAWGGVLGAPVAALVIVVLTSLTTWHSPAWLLGLLIAGFLGGFGFLVATMPRERDDPWDDGARL